MKKSLLFAAIALLAVSAGNAQMKRSDLKVKKVDAQIEKQMRPMAKMAEAKMNVNGKMVAAASLTPKDNAVAWYNRPAGSFYVRHAVNDLGVYIGSFQFPFVVMKPYEEYTWKNASQGADSYEWLVQMVGLDPETNKPARLWFTTDETDLVTAYGWEWDTIPALTAFGADGSNTYQLYHNKNEVNPRTGKVTTTTYTCEVAAAPTMPDMFGDRMLASCHFDGVRNKVDENSGVYYYGENLIPHGDNQYGWYFGKNDNGLDGICQLFEKPEHPYALNAVAVDAATIKVADDGGELTAKVYKLKVDQPQYQTDASVYLTEDDLELLSTSTVLIDTTMLSNGFYMFPIMETIEVDGEQLSFETQLQVDYPLFVEITGYNGDWSINEEEGKLEYTDNGIVDFSGSITTDENDEGFGEMAFIKRLRWVDGEGNILEEPYYVYQGICNFFQNSADMKPGFNIYLEVEMPFLTYYYTAEDGEYEFPVEGGKFTKTYSESLTVDYLSLYSYLPSEDWYITTVDDEDLPDWLTIEPEDIYEVDEETGEEEFSGEVQLNVEAAPLPEGVAGRECTVKFGYTGVELLYHFTQGDTSGSGLLVGDVNRDGRVNVSDVSALINMILGITEKDMETADVNGDGKVNVSDVSALINIILGITA